MKGRAVFLYLFLLGVALLLVGEPVVAEPVTVVVEFDRIAHLTPDLDVSLICDDGEVVGSYSIPPAPLSWIHHMLGFEAMNCLMFVLAFDGVVYGGLGQKIDNVSLSVDGVEVLVNGDFSNGIEGWDNLDIGVDGVSGGWYWSVPPKEEAKLDGEGSGANAVWGIQYRLSQTVQLGSMATAIPTDTAVPGATVTPSLTPTPVSGPTVTPTPGGGRWCQDHPGWPGCPEVSNGIG
jgi:hypothetical protein